MATIYALQRPCCELDNVAVYGNVTSYGKLIYIFCMSEIIEIVRSKEQNDKNL